MGNPTSGYQTITPILGSQQQQQYLQTIASQAFNTGPSGQGPDTIQGITPYGGQLTPDLSQMMLSGVDAAWSPNSPGQAQMAQQYSNILGQQNQVNAANPLAALQKYATGSGGSPTTQTPSNPYSALMTPPAVYNPGNYTYQSPTSTPQSSGSSAPGTGLQQSTVPVSFSYPQAPVQAPQAATTPAPVAGYNSISIPDPSLRVGLTIGPQPGTPAGLAAQRQTSLQTSAANNTNPFVNYNPAFSAAAWSPSFV